MSSIAGFHYHFYQPPREDPWTGLTTHEWSAWPYHDWNERITAECYRALIAVSLPDEDGNSSLFEPLAQSSFDLGPTLHHWLAHHAPDVDRALLRQVRQATKGPRGVVMAAPLVHAIVPLASPTDQERLVAWGIDDYRRRYDDHPLGFWLPETGVDLASLEVLARHGISYTVLMPTQARRVRPLEGEWSDVTPETLDTSRAYVVVLPSGARIKVVFGNFDLSHRVAFGDLLADGDAFADALADVVANAQSEAGGGAASEGTSDDGRELTGSAVALVVADGETYGHHHRFGDLGVAWATRRLQQKYQLCTTLGEWLQDHEPEREVQLHEASAWSCAHGVERWRSACGCVTGERAGFDLEWRAPLRQALDWLRENGGAALDWELGHHVRSSDDALLEYGKVISGEWSPAHFVERHQSRELDDDERSRVLEICEAHRNLMFSFTSCAWFFADPGEIETSIVLRYAALALELTRRTTGRDFESPFVERLLGVRSAFYGVAGDTLWARACEGFRADEIQIAAAAAAEFVILGNFARTSRGTWDIDCSWREGGEVLVRLTNTLTLRRFTFLTHVSVGENLSLHVDISDTTLWRRVALGDMGVDTVARIAVARLVALGSDDVDAALNVLASDLLDRSASTDDEVTLLALARTPRFVSPLGEAAIRRALWTMAAHDGPGVDRPALDALARAVGVRDSSNH